MRTTILLGAVMLANCSVSARPAPMRSAAQIRPGARSTAQNIDRQALLAVLDAGIPRFLQRVETEPALNRGRFVGFRLRAFFSGDERFRGVDIQAGDVITRVNGSTIERPEHAFRIWQELRVASELRIEYLRQHQTRELRYWIVDPA